jgi:hypothetical protein
MQRRISVFGVIAGAIIIIAFGLLLLGVTQTQNVPQAEKDQQAVNAEQSRNSFVYTAMAIGAVLLLVSLIRKSQFRAFFFIAGGGAALFMAMWILSLYADRDLPGISIPLRIENLFDFSSWARLFGMSLSIETATASLLMAYIPSILLIAMIAGAIHAAAKSSSHVVPHAFAGVTALTALLVIAVSIAYTAFINPDVWKDLPTVDTLPVLQQIFTIYAGIFALVLLIVLIITSLTLLQKRSGGAPAKISFWLLAVWACSLPVFLGAMIFRIVNAEDLLKASYFADGKWQALYFVLIDCALLLLPLVFIANGVSLLLQRFAQPAVSQTAPEMPQR